MRQSGNTGCYTLWPELVYDEAMKPLPFLVILGRQPELGLLELESQLGAAAVAPFGRLAAVITGVIELARYGGVVKLGQILYQGPVAQLDDVPLDLDALAAGDGKVNFA